MSVAQYLNEGLPVTVSDEAREVQSSIRSVIPVGDDRSRLIEVRVALDKQVWVIGAGAPDGNQIVFEPMIITSGANFGSEFNPADVVRRTFGKITADFSDCNNFIATVDSDLPEFSDIVLDVEKIVPGPCP
jgi:hypothetical protein